MTLTSSNWSLILAFASRGYSSDVIVSRANYCNRSRTIPHDDVQEYLTARFYLSPSRLYSAVRLLPNKQGYDVPVAGDWVTIAVVAERGQVKVSKAPVGIGREGDVDDEGSNELVGDGHGRISFEDKKPAKPKRKDPVPRKPSGKKYVNMKLVDFGARSRSSATGGKATIRGDAFLSLLLFESDGYDKVTRDDGRVEKVYKGGSRGAFEAMSKLKEGDVVALLNCKILKPFQVRMDTIHLY
jgi:minichromosome maintenance protein 10